MKRLPRKWVVWGVVALVVLGLIGFRISQSLQADPERQAMSGFRRIRGAETVSVRVEPVQRSTVESVAVFSSSLQAEQEIDVFPRMAGRIASVNVKEGQPVKTGTLIARLDDEELGLQFKQISARLQAGRTSLRQIETRLKRAQLDLKRVQQLYDRNAATQQELENVRYQVENAEIDFAVAQTQLQQTEADYALMKLRLKNVNIEAPISGVVTSSLPIVGNQVGTSTLIARVTALDPLEVVFNVPEREISKVKVGQSLLISTDAFPGQQFKGEIYRLEAAINPQTRTLEVRGRVANPQFKLRPGMFARVELVLDQKQDVLAVPREAIILQAGGKYVYTVQEGQARLRKVQTGLEGRERVEITAGLQEGELVVVVGQQGLQDGQSVVAVGKNEAAPRPALEERRPSEANQGVPRRQPGARPGSGTIRRGGSPQ